MSKPNGHTIQTDISGIITYPQPDSLSLRITLSKIGANNGITINISHKI